MKNNKIIVFGLIVSFLMFSCQDDILDYTPTGVLSNEETLVSLVELVGKGADILRFSFLGKYDFL